MMPAAPYSTRLAAQQGADEWDADEGAVGHDGGTHQHGALGSTDGRNGLAGEIKVAGSVHDVDADVLIFDRGKGQRNRDLALDLLGVVVADGVAVGGTAQTIRSLGHEEHLLGQSRLAGAP